MTKKKKIKELKTYEIRFTSLSTNNERKAKLTTDLNEEELREILNYNVDIISSMEEK